MKRLVHTLLFLSSLSLTVWSQGLAAETVKAEVEVKELGAFDKMNMMRKLVGVGMDAKSASADKDEAQKEMEEQFSSEQIDEAKLKDASEKMHGAISELSASVGKMIDVLAEYAPDEALSKKGEAKASEPKELAKDEAPQIPANFSADKIKRIREIKAKNQAIREALKDSFNMKNPEAMAKLVKASKEERAVFVKKFEETGHKGFELSLEEYREMRSFLTAPEMKTYFTLQSQMKEKKEKALAEKMKEQKEARKNAEREAKKLEDEKEKEKAKG